MRHIRMMKFSEYGALPPLPTILANMAHAPYSHDKIKFSEYGELPPPPSLWPLGGLIGSLLKIDFSDTQKWSKKCFFGVMSQTKVARNLILSDFNLKRPSWDENWRFEMGGQIWPPPRTE